MPLVYSCAVSCEFSFAKALSFFCSQFISSSRLHMERSIPSYLLKNAAGYAILSVLKVGMGWSAAVGTGLIVARRQDGTWSPPSAIGLGSFGWGLQLGGELTDVLLVLSNSDTVKVRPGSEWLYELEGYTP
jgi:SH3 domain-containing YSC84-like protein 1